MCLNTSHSLISEIQSVSFLLLSFSWSIQSVNEERGKYVLGTILLENFKNKMNLLDVRTRQHFPALWDLSISADRTVTIPGWSQLEPWRDSRQGPVIRSPYCIQARRFTPLLQIHQLWSSLTQDSAHLFAKTLIFLCLDHFNTSCSPAAEIFF